MTHNDQTDPAGDVSMFARAVAYAADKCGFVVTRANRSTFAEGELRMWQAAVAEYSERLLDVMLRQPAREVVRGA